MNIHITRTIERKREKRVEKYIDILLDSMLKHDAESLPMADRYRATENGIPSAVRHMACWRTITGFTGIAHKVIDERMNSIVVVAEALEGNADVPSLLSARMQIADDKISELEIYLLRSRNQSGFWFKPEELHTLPEGWFVEMKPEGKASYEELYHLGEAINNENIKVFYPGGPGCFGMENGGIVREHIEYMSGMESGDGPFGPGGPEGPAGPGGPEGFGGPGGPGGEGGPFGMPPIDPSLIGPDGRFAPPFFGIFPERPTDLKCRVLAVDEEQGLVACYGTIPGTVTPYIVPDETSTCFVPDNMIEMHRKWLTPERMAGHSVLEEETATAMVTVIAKLYEGKIYGYHQIIVLTGRGYQCPWEK